ncbi:MAG TPA: hypothetical protein VFW64_15895 [Pseudonocardiaceae bacterium]|nr:hypothetical protein [Pseudonocardiaceae bacterium]
MSDQPLIEQIAHLHTGARRRRIGNLFGRRRTRQVFHPRSLETRWETALAELAAANAALATQSQTQPELPSPE